MGTADLTSANFWRSAEPYLMGRADDEPGLRQCVGAGDWCLAQTSGTEGASKWVALTKRGLLISAEAVNNHLKATSTDRWLIALPTHHVGGFAIYARAFVSDASVAHLQGKWAAQRFAEACANERITLTSLVPTQVFDLVRENLPAPPCLRAIVVGGGELSKEVGMAARALGWPVLQSFGMSEAGSQIATAPLDQLDRDFDPNAMQVLAHWQLEVNEADQHLRVRGPALAHGYALNEGVGHWRWQPIDVNQGLITRDRVALWNQGSRQFLRFIGRESQALKIMGELVYLGPLQARLDAIVMSHHQAVIVPKADERKGTALVLAYTTHHSEAQAEAWLQAFNTTAAPFERLDRIIQVPHIPVTDLGKVRMSELTDLVQ